MSDTRMNSVYIAEIRECCDRGIGGVYASVEAAKKAHAKPDERWTRGDYFGGECWQNNLNGDNYVVITEFAVEG